MDWPGPMKEFKGPMENFSRTNGDLKSHLDDPWRSIEVAPKAHGGVQKQFRGLVKKLSSFENL